MNKLDFKIMADYSDTVRESTLKRLKIVPEGKENFRLNEKSMSIADIANHLIDCDKSLIKILVTKNKNKNLGKASNILIRNRKEFARLLRELEVLKIERKKFILSLDNENMKEKVKVDSISGMKEEQIGLLIYKMLDHEAHHRGQLVILLKLIL